MAAVKDEYQPLSSGGQLDRMVTVMRDCGHDYQWGGPIDAPLPEPGAPAMRCLGPQPEPFQRPADLPAAPAIIDERKRPVKRLRPRKGDAA